MNTIMLSVLIVIGIITPITFSVCSQFRGIRHWPVTRMVIGQIYKTNESFFYIVANVNDFNNLFILNVYTI